MSIVEGKNVVVSGTIAGHSRGTAQAALQALGARCQSSMGPSTDLLITGVKAGPNKLTKAEALGIEIVSWEQAIGNGSATTESAASAPRILDAIRIVSPQLAKAADTPPIGDNWLHEVKWDGYRCISTVKDGEIAMQSRSGLSEYVEQFPKVAAALVGLGRNFVIDGELVVTDVNGHTSFETAHTATAGGTEAYMVFDILELDGEDVRDFPLEARRAMLRNPGVSLVKGLLQVDADPVRFSPSHDDGQWLLDWTAERKLEGIVSKNKASIYIEGSRMSDWQKIKVRLESEFLICGYTPGEGARAWAFGALILGRYGPDGELVYAGKVGTGFDDDCLADLRDRMLALDAKELPPHFPKTIIRDGLGLDPQLIAQIQYQRVTKDGSLWHPAFKRLWTDKRPEEVVVE